jgi:hypothetical protein
MPHDLGITSDWKHETYSEYFPEAWELVDSTTLSVDELEKHEEFSMVLKRNRDQ